MEGEGERNLKALPHVVAWFERAGEAVADDEGGEESCNMMKESSQQCINLLRLCHYCLYLFHTAKEVITSEREMILSYHINMNALRCLSSCFLFFGRV